LAHTPSDTFMGRAPHLGHPLLFRGGLMVLVSASCDRIARLRGWVPGTHGARTGPAARVAAAQRTTRWPSARGRAAPYATVSPCGHVTVSAVRSSANAVLGNNPARLCAGDTGATPWVAGATASTP
jgi:hypothetical protein